MIKEVLRHPAAHIALALITGLPLVSCAKPESSVSPAPSIPASSDSFTGKAPVPPEVIQAVNNSPEIQSGRIKAANVWTSLFTHDLTNNNKTMNLRFNITQQFQVKNQPFTVEDLIKGLLPIDQTILTARSALTDNRPASGYSVVGSGAKRMSGITEIRGVRVEYSPKSLTLEQQANNVKQAGTANIRFLARGAYAIWEGKDAFGYKAIEQAKTPSVPSLSPNIPWREQERIIDLATGKISGFGDASINEMLNTPVTVNVGCYPEILGYGGEQSCLFVTT